jgi:hypothetical protein
VTEELVYGFDRQALAAIQLAVNTLFHPSEVVTTVIEPHSYAPQLRVVLPGDEALFAHLGPFTDPRDPWDVFERVFDQLQDFVPDHQVTWGQARPACPGHPHPMILLRTDEILAMACPREPQVPVVVLDRRDRS